MAAPLLIGSDLRKASPQTLDILGNKEVIAVDQDRSASRARWSPPTADAGSSPRR